MKNSTITGLTALPLLAASVAGAAERQNVLYIMTDQQSYYMISAIAEQLGSDQYAVAKNYLSTPNLDKLVKNGYTFSNCYVGHPVSGPSRFALLTGEAPNAYGMTGNFTPTGQLGQAQLAAIDARAMGTMFKNAGYETFYGGKCHLPWANGNSGKGSIYEKPYRYGFTNQLTDDDRDVLATEGAEFFSTYKGEKPFLLFLSFMNPHDICMTQVLFGDRKIEDYTADEIDMRARKNQIRWRDEVYKPMDKAPFNTDELSKLPVNTAPTDVWPLGRGGSRNKPADAYSMHVHIWFYYRLMEQVDAEIGQVLDALEKSPYKDNTTIIFTSDHGEMAYSHGLTGKNFPYEECQKVPLIFVAKGVKRGVLDTTTPVCNAWDLIPTMLDLSGIDIPAEYKGVSLLKTITEGRKPDRKYIYLETVNSFGVLGEGRYKYVNFVIKDAQNGTEVLFDLEKDPGELKNLINDPAYASKVKELKEALAVQMKHFGSQFATLANKAGAPGGGGAND